MQIYQKCAANEDGPGVKITTLTEYKCHDTQALKLLQALAYARETSLPNSSAAITDSSETTMDSDSDGTNDIIDNCLATPNPNQNDADGDGVGDACDNCPSTGNQDQADTDSDRIGDACDHCPADNNPDCGRCIANRGPAAGKPCIFPFKYQNVSPSHFTLHNNFVHSFNIKVEHYSCADWIYNSTQPQPEGTTWCSTKVLVF